jgi:hypothetical protein
MGEPMMTLLLLALGLDGQEPPRSPFRAELTIERFAKREDGVHLQSGTLSVRPGEALAFDAPASRLRIRGAAALERRAGERVARRWDLSKPENFQPLDLWRLDAAEVRRQFRVLTDHPAETRELPPSVVSAEGTPVPPAAVKPGASLAMADGVDRAEGCARVVLVPNDPKLRERITSIRLSVDRASGLIRRIVVDSPTQILTLTLGDYRAVASLDDAVFDLDVSNLKVEER